VRSSHIESSAQVSATADLGENVKIWHFSQIRENVFIGDNVVIGSMVHIGSGVRIGSNSKIQNSALIYEPAIIGPGVFIGPGVIFTNDHNPRAINPDGLQKNASDWNSVRVEVEEGASIGAGAICIAPVKIGRWASIGAGAVVTKTVKPFALMVGIPARQVGWVGRAGKKLTNINSNVFICPQTKETYLQVNEELVPEGFK
jgi:UDP-2-acetamido-3-amino-2,3-dideoxy-glucuronate N-acetyltransferase